jgi:putative flavoprotein involved in K+ transport
MQSSSSNEETTVVEGAPEDIEVAVVGGGQAGLAIGYFLSRGGRRFKIFEAADSVGAAWKGRWDSLTLFTPRRYDALPGMEFPGEPDSYPTRDDVISYLDDYVARFELPVELGSEVRVLSRNGSRFFLELTDGRKLASDQVVVATGPFQKPLTPSVAGRLSAELFQIHSTGYRRPSDVPDGTVLVVGGGNTGYQIAEELSATHAVSLAVGSRQTPLPQRFLGHDVFWWLTKVGALDRSVDSRLGQRLRGRDTLIGSSPRKLARQHGVGLKPRVITGHDRTICFADSSELQVDAVIWATGYRPDNSWIDLPIFDADGRFRHRRGVTDVPGLYFLGLSWQHTRGSALLGWVKDDAEYIAAEIGVHAIGDARANAGEYEHDRAPETTAIERLT